MRDRYTIQPLRGDTFCIDDAFGDHMYLVCGKERAMLIDAGMGEKGLLPVVRTLTKLPVELINTHGHLDHIGGDPEFGRAYLHPADGELFREHAGEGLSEDKNRGTVGGTEAYHF